MLKQKYKIQKILSSRIGLLALGGLLVIGLASGVIVRADQYDQQIRALEQQNANKEDSLYDLQIQAGSYQDAINKLQGRINYIEGLILKTQAKQAAVKKKIASAEAQLKHQRIVLGEAIKAMYLEGQTSTVEVLLSSDNLSDFVDQEQYHITVENNVKSLVDKITALKLQLKKQNDKLTELLHDQKTQQTELATARNRQNQLLSLNQDQQSSFNRQIAANNAEISRLRAEQAAALAAITGSNGTSPTGSSIVYRNMTSPQSCGGGYGYCWAGLDQYVNDDWGLHYARECVHYVANALASRGYYIPYNLFAGRGNANQWVGTATGTGTASLVSSPQKDDVVYFPVGSLGHVAIVDWVNSSDGTLHVSQMNWYPGQYNTMDVVKTSNLQYLRFHQ